MSNTEHGMNAVRLVVSIARWFSVVRTARQLQLCTEKCSFAAQSARHNALITSFRIEYGKVLWQKKKNLQRHMFQLVGSWRHILERALIKCELGRKPLRTPDLLGRRKKNNQKRPSPQCCQCCKRTHYLLRWQSTNNPLQSFAEQIASLSAVRSPEVLP